MKPKRCDSCDFVTEKLQVFDGRRGDVWLCKLCSHTASGNTVTIPGSHKEVNAVLKTICFAGNEILSKIEALAAGMKKGG